MPHEVTLTLRPPEASAIRQRLLHGPLAGAAEVVTREAHADDPDLAKLARGREALEEVATAIDQLGWAETSRSVELTMDADVLLGELQTAIEIESNAAGEGADLKEIEERHATMAMLFDLVARVEEQYERVGV